MEDPQVAPSNIVINGEEFSPDEAQQLIDTGRKTREYEQKYSTKLESVWPEYGRLSTERSKWEKDQVELAELRKKVSDFNAKQEAGTETAADRTAARKAAKELGIMLDEDVQGKFLTKDDVDSLLEEKLTQREKMRAATDEILKEAKSLESELNGEDGRPKFKTKMVLAYAQAYGKTNLREAYEEMNSDELTSWQESQKTLKKGPSLKTLSSGAKKTPEEVRPTKDNAREMLHEALLGSNE